MAHSPATELVQYYDELVNYISKVFGNRQLATEIVQETYLRVLQKPEKFSELEHPIAFLKIASCNIGRDYLRKNQLEVAYVEQERIEHTFLSEFESLFTHQELVVAKQQYSHLILQKIQQLPPTCQDVFLLIQFYAMSQVEVAEQLGISRMMVIKHLTRALQSFLPVFIELKDE
ncbi:MAG: sigma-70 family RNA polymerase sigma factor [Acinetobacter populi]|uniref:RNA polymerase sigma factor n=1 Tax=Acinetobacter populi TaxID=1582270 RepID=UPI002357E06E|nr:sigma-70 family RNA polymerase sigma factor [Acinetobacter populi]MCH4248812.1 sigma-70 family RNA polymerase sigma factor [Acinetobacter populi]